MHRPAVCVGEKRLVVWLAVHTHKMCLGLLFNPCNEVYRDLAYSGEVTTACGAYALSGHHFRRLVQGVAPIQKHTFVRARGIIFEFEGSLVLLFRAVPNLAAAEGTGCLSSTALYNVPHDAIRSTIRSRLPPHSQQHDKTLMLICNHVTQFVCLF